MGIVSDFLQAAVAKQVEDNGVVVWYDPEKHYSSVPDNLNVSDTQVERFEGSFFELRHRIEPLLEGDKPPRLIVYVPKDQAACHSALVEAEVAGVVMKPGQQPPPRNTRLSIIARNALKPILAEKLIASVEKDVEDGRLSLAELDEIAGKGGVSHRVVSTIFKTENSEDIALQFLTDSVHDEEIQKRDAQKELSKLLEDTVQATVDPDSEVQRMRTDLGRHVLATDFLTHLEGPKPKELASVSTAKSQRERETCLHLAKQWRQTRELEETYAEAAGRVEQELGIEHAEFDSGQLTRVETFLATERKLQEEVEKAIYEEPTSQSVALADERQGSFWSISRPRIQTRWRLIEAAGRLLLETERVGNALKAAELGAYPIAKQYVAAEEPWCQLEAFHRILEQRYFETEFDAQMDSGLSEKLVARCRHRYMEVASLLMERFLFSYADSMFKLKGFLSQREVFKKKVKPHCEKRKTAYFLVDALRFDLGRELEGALQSEFEVEIEPALATPPTITEVGMAALMPGADESFEILPGKKGKLAVKIDGVLLSARKDRIKFFQERAGFKTVDTKLDSLLPKPSSALRKKIRDAELVLVTAQEIDDMCEQENAPLARDVIESVMRNMPRAFRVLADLGVETIVVTADHGYLFGEEMSDDQKIDSPGGHTVDLHRRAWIGKGGAASPACLRTTFDKLGIEGNLEIAVPKGFACFKVPGGHNSFFHGGLSPQEVLIPVLTLWPKERFPVRGADETWGIEVGGSAKKLGRFCSFTITGQSSLLTGIESRKVQIEVREEKRLLSKAVSATYGFEDATGEIQIGPKEDDLLRSEPNTVAVMIEKDPEEESVSVHLIDASSGFELARLENVEVALGVT